MDLRLKGKAVPIQGQSCANLQQRFHQLINIGEWIDGDSKRFAAAILKMILLYTLGILESIGCMSRQLGIHIAGFLIIRKVSGQGILYCRIILENLVVY